MAPIFIITDLESISMSQEAAPVLGSGRLCAATI
jgi:hypothetical protein